VDAINNEILMYALPVTGIIIGTGVGYVIRKKVAEKQIGSAEEKAQEIVKTARLRAEAAKKEMIIEAKDEVHKARVDLEKEVKDRRNEISRAERRQIQREENLDKKISSIDKKEDQIQRKIKETTEKKEEVERLHQIQMTELERISGLSRDEAKSQLLSEVEKDIRHDSIVMMKDIESRAKEEAEKKAKNIVAFAIQKCAADHVAETTVSVVNLPNDEMKGRIIGREGRNIRALETLTGVDLIIDDTPEAVILSSFDPIRREVARVALEKLIVDGRIHPARIEEMVAKAQKEIDAQIKQEGENATFDVGIHNLHPELVKLIGRLKFRTSYGQNVLKHSQEVAYLAGIMAAEVGADARLAKRAGLLHDIGKAVDHEIEGTHIEIGMNLLKKYKESKHVIHAMSTHHGDYEPETIEAVLVTAADAISAARPGARRESLENYVNRLESLEKIANDKDGVEYSYAIQAGREIRIMVMPEKITDDDMILLARDIKKQVEEELEYPGHIKIHMIRETRHVNYAK